MSKGFSDLPAICRFAAREMIEDCGGYVAGYVPGGLTVALPRVGALRLINQMVMAGFADRGGCLFPLGSDNPPDSLRHFGSGSAAAPRGDRPGYWLYWRFTVAF